MSIVVAIRDRASQYVHQGYNFDLEERRFIPDGGGPQLTSEGEILLSSAEMDCWVAACQDAMLCETILLAGLEALWRAQQLERKGPSECMQAAVEAMLAILGSLPVFVGSLMESPLERQQEHGTLSVAGWAATQISLEHNRRLRQTLTRDDLAVDAPAMSPFATLLEQLPAHTYEAWHEEGWTTLEELRTRIASLLEGYGIDPGLPAHLSPDSLQQLQQEVAQWGSSQGALEEWAATQEASQRLDEIAEGCA
jgi:hypothetical protein